MLNINSNESSNINNSNFDSSMTCLNYNSEQNKAAIFIYDIPEEQADIFLKNLSLNEIEELNQIVTKRGYSQTYYLELLETWAKNHNSRDSVLLYMTVENEVSTTNSNNNGSSIQSGELTEEEQALAEELDTRFKGKLNNKGKVIIEIAKKYDIDPKLFSGIIGLETGWGKSSACNNKNNPGGIMKGSASNGLQSFSTIDEGLEYMAKLLKESYIEQGLTSPYEIGNKYCPGDVYWPVLLNQIIKELS